MTRSDRIALIFSLIGVLAAYLVAGQVFDFMSHLEDEMAYVWQAQAISRGQMTVPIPSEPKSFLVPFVVDYNGHRFGKYPLGWPALLAVGVALGARSLVNPLLAGLGVWLTYRLGKMAFSEKVGLLAAGLTLTSPFFLVNSGSLLSHPWGLVLSAAFAMAWLDAFTGRSAPAPKLPVIAAGLTLGALALTRPLTAVGVGLPFAVHGLYLLVRGPWAIRRQVLLVGLLAGGLGVLHFAWQWAVTDDPFLNPYTLWWSYDQLGFGPGIGRNPEGHTLRQAWINTRHSLWGGFPDLFGWGHFSWVFLPVGLVAIFRRWRCPNLRAVLVSLPFAMLVVIYMAYWIGSSLFGPRYYYEGLFSLTILSAAGIALLAGWYPLNPYGPSQLPRRLQQLRPVVTALLVIGLVAGSLASYLPWRLGGMKDLYGIRRERIEPFLAPEAQQYAPALIIVHPEKKWTEFGALLELSNPFLDSPFLFVHTRGPENDARVSAHFPERAIFHYYPDEPFTLYTGPRPGSE